MAEHKNGYQKGIDRDSSEQSYNPLSYYSSKNMKPYGFGGLGMGAMQSIPGNVSKGSLPAGYESDYVIGWLEIRDYVVLWTTSCNEDVDTPDDLSSPSRGTIWRLSGNLDDTGAITWTKVYEDSEMNLSAAKMIANETVGFYIDEDHIIAYWTDNFNMFRHIDIITPGVSDVSELDMLMDVDLEPPTVQNIVGGRLEVGKVQYAYQLYNKRGVQTAYSMATGLVHLTNQSEKLSGSMMNYYEGNPKLDETGDPFNSGKSVVLKFDDLDDTYDKIRVVSIHYSTMDTLPVVNIVGDYDVEDDLIVTDTGAYEMGNITLNEFRTMGNHELILKSITSRNNKIVAFNVKEKYFDIDFDARAYRFRDNSGTCELKLWDSKTATKDTVTVAGTWPNQTYKIGGVDVPDDHDCICPYNWDYANDLLPETATYDDTDDEAYVYQHGCSVIGGSGPNVKYKFITEGMTSDVSTDPRYQQPDTVKINDLTSFDSYKNPMRVMSYMGYKRDEIYRIGLRFKDTKGRMSFVKWVGDIRFPTVSQNITCERGGMIATPEQEIYALGLEVTVDTRDLPDNIQSFEIVRVKREEKDRTIYTQGVASKTYFWTGTNHWSPLPRTCLKTPVHEGTQLESMKIIQFISPEVNYFKDINPNSSHYLKLAGVLKERYTYSDMQDVTHAAYSGREDSEWSTMGYSTEASFEIALKVRSQMRVDRYREVEALTTLTSYDIVDGALVGPVIEGAEEENELLLNTVSYPYVNRCRDYDGGSLAHEGAGGTCLALLLDSDISVTALSGSDKYELYLMDYKIGGNALTIYDGITYEARRTNEYISTGAWSEIATDDEVVDVFGGDIFIGQHEHLNCIMESQDTDQDGSMDVDTHARICHILNFPAESIINLDLAHGEKHQKSYSAERAFAIREESGDHLYWIDGTHSVYPDDSDTFIQKDDMYQYNNVYSQQNTTQPGFIKPDDWDETVHRDTLVKLSQEKTSNELFDSYLMFLSDNEKLLPTDYGVGTKLFKYKNYILAFFERGIGQLPIDERALLPIQNNSILELGAGKQMEGFSIISDRVGCIHPLSVVAARRGFMWYDAISKGLYRYSGSEEDLGLVKGLSSEMKTLGERFKDYDNPYNGGNIQFNYNPGYKEVIMAFSRTCELTYDSHTSTAVTFTGATGIDDDDYEVYINGTKYTASVDSDEMELNTTDNSGLVPSSFSTGGPFVCIVTDLSEFFVYSEILDAVVAEIDIAPHVMLNYQNELYTLVSGRNLYRENAGLMAHFQGEYKKQSIRYIINPARNYICIYNNYKFTMDGENITTGEKLSRVWDRISIENSYQETGEITLTGNDIIRRRHRRYRIDDPRSNDSVYPRPRMRDTYVNLLLEYDSDANERLKMHTLYTYYQVERETYYR